MKIKVKDFLEYEKFINQEHTDSEMVEFAIKIFYHLNDDKIKKMTGNDIIKKYNNISKILNKKYNVTKSFRLKGVTYSIDTNADWTFGEYVDINPNDMLQRFSVLYRQLLKNGKIEEHDAKKYYERYEIFKENLNVEIYLGFIVFFCQNIQKELKNTLNYIVEESDLTVKEKNNLARLGAGILGYIDLAEEIS